VFDSLNHNEKALLHRLKDGDQNAFTEIYNLYHRGIYAYILGYVKIPQMAEDLTQEVFLKIWEVKGRLVVNTSFSAYIYRISHNRSIDALKKIAREQKLHSEVLSHIQPPLPQLPIDNNKYEKLYLQALAGLPPQRLKVFRLCREQGKSYEETANELGISHNTVKQHMVLALRFLRGYLMEKGAILSIATIVHIIFIFLSTRPTLFSQFEV
jgi:RNA polymerase sigma-70 factor (family 1)